MTDKIVVLITCPNAEEASKLARALVEDRLAACVNVTGPVRSFYWWRGSIEQDEEVLLFVKSSRALFPKLAQRVRKLHTYEVPEIIALQIVDGDQAYLDWMDRELAPAAPPEAC